MEPDRRPVVYATFAWLVAAGALVAIVALHTSTPPGTLGEEASGAPAAEPAGEPVPEPAVPSETAPEPDANVTVPQDTNHTFEGWVRSNVAGPGSRSHTFSTEPADGGTHVDFRYSDRQPTNTTTFPGQKVNVGYEILVNGSVAAGGGVSSATWGPSSASITVFVDDEAADWEIRLTYDWPSDFDYTFYVDVYYPR
jgi:hypothetical protein